MKKSKSSKSNNQQLNGHNLSFRFAKLLDPDANWDKDQLLDVLHWFRQALGLACGLTWGAAPLVGAIWIVLFLVLSSGIIYGYYAHVLKIDEEEFGGHGALIQEGLFASFTLFLILAFCIYTAQHSTYTGYSRELNTHITGKCDLFCDNQLAWILVYSLAHF